MIQRDDSIRFGRGDRGVWVIRQPTPVDIQTLSTRGVRAILSLREDDEDYRIMSNLAEASWASAFGMEYAHVRLAPDALTPEDFERVARALGRLPRPVAMHSRDTEHAAAFASVLYALEEGVESEEAWAMAAEQVEQAAASLEAYRFVVREIERRSIPRHLP